MTEKFFCLACNGLHEELFGGPLTQLVHYLNIHLPVEVHFNVVGGVDPRPFTDQITHNLVSAAGAGYKIIFLGHSLGAMMAFYQADRLNERDIHAPLFISIDPTQWGTNAVGTAAWLLGGSNAGRYYVPPNVAKWINFTQPVYPGGGRAQLVRGNKLSKFEEFPRLEPHVVLPVTPAVQDIILRAILAEVLAK